jgi:hypothetical protein
MHVRPGLSAQQNPVRRHGFDRATDFDALNPGSGSGRLSGKKSRYCRKRRTVSMNLAMEIGFDR